MIGFIGCSVLAGGVANFLSAEMPQVQPLLRAIAGAAVAVLAWRRAGTALGPAG